MSILAQNAHVEMRVEVEQKLVVQSIGSGHVVIAYGGEEHICSEGTELRLKATVTRSWDS